MSALTVALVVALAVAAQAAAFLAVFLLLRRRAAGKDLAATATAMEENPPDGQGRARVT